MRAAFLLELGGILLGLTVLSRLATRFSFSPIPLFLGLGLLLGPSGPLAIGVSRDFIETGAELGAILLLFSLGLEYSVDELLEGAKRSRIGGPADFVLNFLPGFVGGWILGWSLAAAFILGGITYISSSGIVARLIRDMGWMGNRETPAILSILVVEDLAMAAYLAAAGAIVLGEGFGAATSALALAAVLVAIVLVAAKRYGERLSKIMFTPSDESVLLGLLGLVLAVAGLAERVHISAAVGAFLVGLAVSGEGAHQTSRLLGPLRDLFGAAFFLFFGLQVAVGELSPLLLPAAVLVVVGIATKLLTGWIAAREFGVGVEGRRRAGAMLVPRGEFSIIIAELGVAAGLQAELAPLATLFVLALAAIGPVLVHFTGRSTNRTDPERNR